MTIVSRSSRGKDLFSPSVTPLYLVHRKGNSLDVWEVVGLDSLHHPLKSSQYSTFSPTKPDKIENLHSPDTIDTET